MTKLNIERLHHAIREDNLPLIQEILTAEPAIVHDTYNDILPLNLASEIGNTQIINYLLQVIHESPLLLDYSEISDIIDSLLA